MKPDSWTDTLLCAWRAQPAASRAVAIECLLMPTSYDEAPIAREHWAALRILAALARALEAT